MTHHRWQYCLLALFCFLLIPTLAADEDILDQGWFLNACQGALAKSAESSQSSFTSGYCYGYLEGLRHAGDVANHFVTRPELWGRQLWCIPEGESLEAVAQSVIAELNIAPDHHEANYPVAVMRSLKKHYPCQ